MAMEGFKKVGKYYSSNFDKALLEPRFLLRFQVRVVDGEGRSAVGGWTRQGVDVNDG